MSADALTSFEEPTPGLTSTGTHANDVIDGGDPNSTRTGITHTEVAGEATAVAHVEAPPGFGSDNKPEPEGGDTAGKPDAVAHVEAPPGFGSDVLPETKGTALGKPEVVEHTEAPPGYGHDVASPPDENLATAGGTPSHEVVAEVEPVPHQEMPPGYGSNLPPDGMPEAVPLGEGQLEGPPDLMASAPPKIPTPFETEYEGKPMITLSGTIVVEGEGTGTVDLDCFVPMPDTPAKRKMVNKVKVDEPGPFSMQVPANFGPLIIAGFIDIEQDGPDHSDPQGSYSGNPLTIGDKDITGIDITLKSQ